MSALFSDSGFYAVSLQKAFLEKFHNVDKKSLWALPDDPHPGPRVHEFYANEIFDILQPQVARLLKKDRKASGEISEVLRVSSPAKVVPSS